MPPTEPKGPQEMPPPGAAREITTYGPGKKHHTTGNPTSFPIRGLEEVTYDQKKAARDIVPGRLTPAHSGR